MVGKVFRYWSHVLRRSLAEVWKFLGIKGQVLFILILGSDTYLLYFSKGQFPWVNVVHPALIILLYVLILLIPVFSLFNAFIVPAKMHEELAGFDRLKIRLRVECESPGYNEAWVNLRIFNDHPIKPISRCYAYLKSVTSEKDETLPLKQVGEKFSWNSDNPPLNGLKEIPPHENRLIDLVCTLHTVNRIMFTTQEENESYKDKADPGNYIVVVGVVGLFSGVAFERESVVRITYSGGRELSCEEVK
jgi:hypothetical protein